MNYALFYAIMQHMWTWGYTLKITAQPCLVVEYAENMINTHGSEEAGIFINSDMDRFMRNGEYANVNPELLLHPTLEDLFIKEPIV